MSLARSLLLLVAALVTLAVTGPVRAERIKDLGAFQGLRANQLTGYGVVVGLQVTGDDNLAYLTEAMRVSKAEVARRMAGSATKAPRWASIVRVRNDHP